MGTVTTVAPRAEPRSSGLPFDQTDAWQTNTKTAVDKRRGVGLSALILTTPSHAIYH